MASITLDEQTVRFIVETIEREIRDAEELRGKAREANCATAEQWCEGKRDGLTHAKIILRSAGISFRI